MSIEHIDDLRVFVQAVESGTLAAAGRILGLAPSIVSRRLARLERALSVRLLQRTTRSLSVTDEGRAFYGRCRNILSELDAAQADLEPTADQVAGTVRAVLSSSVVVHGLLDSLDGLLRAHPRLTVQLRLSDKPADLQSGGWDVALHVGQPQDSTHVSRRLCQVTPTIAASPAYVARHGVPKTPMDLTQHECLRFGTSDRTQYHWPVVDPEGMTHRVPVGGQLISEDLVTLYAALRAGLGIGVMPQSRLKRGVADGTLVEVLPGCRLEQVGLFALMPAGRHRLPRIRVFVDWLAEFMQTLFLDSAAPTGQRRPAKGRRSKT